jgi:SAM-dependent methyltransferase
MDNTHRFSNRADAYRRARPGYPPAVASLIRETCPLPHAARIADIGAGTGLLTRVLLDAGFDVAAVEPNAPMLNAAIEDLGHFPTFHPVPAPAESTTLPASSFDAITVAQAFHWFDHQAARVEFLRILRPGGFVFIIRNHRLPDATPFARAFETLLHTLGDAYLNLQHRDHAAGTRAIQQFFLPASTNYAQFDNPHTLDWPGLRDRLLSVSYAPTPGEPGHDQLLNALESLFNAHAENGAVTFPQITEVYYAPFLPDTV